MFSFTVCYELLFDIFPSDDQNRKRVGGWIDQRIDMGIGRVIEIIGNFSSPGRDYVP